jgi:hypothetical protein
MIELLLVTFAEARSITRPPQGSTCPMLGSVYLDAVRHETAGRFPQGRRRALGLRGSSLRRRSEDRGKRWFELYAAGVGAEAAGKSNDRVRERRRAVALARHFREAEGLSIAEIARRLGHSPAAIKAYFYDPTGEKARAVKARTSAYAAAAAPIPSRVTARATPTRTARHAIPDRSNGDGRGNS